MLYTVVPTSMLEPRPTDLDCPSEPTVVAWGLSASLHLIRVHINPRQGVSLALWHAG